MAEKEKSPYISSRFDVTKEAREKIDRLATQTGIPRFRLLNEFILGLSDKAVDARIKAFKPGKVLKEKIDSFNRGRVDEVKTLLAEIRASGSDVPKELKKDLDELIKG